MCGIIDYHYALSCSDPSCKDPGAWSKTYHTSKTCWADPNNHSKGFKTFKRNGCGDFTKGHETRYAVNVGSATCKTCILKWIQENYRKEGFLANRENWVLKPIPYYLSSPKEKQRYGLMRERQEFIVNEFQKRRKEDAGEVVAGGKGNDDWSDAETLIDGKFGDAW